MKKALILVIAIVAVLILAGCTGKKETSAPGGEVAASGQEAQEITLPPVIDLFQYSEEKNNPYTTHYRFWGWSKNGRVAFTSDFSMEGKKYLC